MRHLRITRSNSPPLTRLIIAITSSESQMWLYQSLIYPIKESLCKTFPLHSSLWLFIDNLREPNLPLVGKDVQDRKVTLVDSNIERGIRWVLKRQHGWLVDMRCLSEVLTCRKNSAKKITMDKIQCSGITEKLTGIMQKGDLSSHVRIVKKLVK